jgi:hypothetical protein
MTSSTFSNSLAALLVVALLTVCAVCKSEDKEQEKQWSTEAARLALAEAKAYEIHAGKRDADALQLTETPVLKWSNSINVSVHGAVFVWMRGDRPEAIASIFKFYSPRVNFSAEFQSLSEQPLVALKNSEVVWQPAEAGVAFKTLADAPVPAKTAPLRLVQMREIARNFSMNLTTVIGKSKHDLRLMSQPLLRYGGKSPGPADGALFAFARGTDPDVILLLEARSSEGRASRWEYALARMHVGALAARYKEKEVWAVEEMAQPYDRKEGVFSQLQNLPEPKID